MLAWLQDWSKRSVGASNSDRARSVAGVPKTYLPVACVREEDGVTFSYDGAKGCTLKVRKCRGLTCDLPCLTN